MQPHEVDANSGNVALRICIICEPQEQARLANTGISDKKELEEVVVSAESVSNLLTTNICASYITNVVMYRIIVVLEVRYHPRMSALYTSRRTLRGCEGCLECLTKTYYSGFMIAAG